LGVMSFSYFQRVYGWFGGRRIAIKSRPGRKSFLNR
jgi:hypothetical protein